MEKLGNFMKKIGYILFFLAASIIIINPSSKAVKIKDERDFVQYQQRKQGNFSKKQEEKFHKKAALKERFPITPLVNSNDFQFESDMREIKTHNLRLYPLWNLQSNNAKFIGILFLTSMLLPVVQGVEENTCVNEKCNTLKRPEPFKKTEESQASSIMTFSVDTKELTYQNSYKWEDYPSVKNPREGYSQRVYRINIGTKFVSGGLEFQPILEARDNIHYKHQLKEYDPKVWVHYDQLQLSYPVGKIFFSDPVKNEEVLVEADLEIPPAQRHTSKEEYQHFGQVKWELDGQCPMPYHRFQHTNFWVRSDNSTSTYGQSVGESKLIFVNIIEHVGFKHYTDYSHQIINLSINNDIIGYKDLYKNLEVTAIQYPHEQTYSLIKNDDTQRKCSYNLETYIVPNNDRCGFPGAIDRKFSIKNETALRAYKYIKPDSTWVWDYHIFARCGEKYDGKYGDWDTEVSLHKRH